jgi:hypothetical protein
MSGDRARADPFAGEWRCGGEASGVSAFAALTSPRHCEKRSDATRQSRKAQAKKDWIASLSSQ